MAKESVQFYEEMEFDNVQYAIDVVNAYKTEYNKAKKGLYLSIFASPFILFVCPFLGLLFDDIFIGLGIGAGVSIASYIMGGGLGSAIKWAWKLGKFGWLILPFPFDLITGYFLMACSLIFFIFFPCIFVYMNYRQIKLDYESAKKYLSYYKKTVNTTPQKVQNQSRVQYTDRRYENQTRSQTVNARATASPSRGNTVNGASARSTSNTSSQSAGIQANSGKTYKVITLSDGSKVYR